MGFALLESAVPLRELDREDHQMIEIESPAHFTSLSIACLGQYLCEGCFLSRVIVQLVKPALQQHAAPVRRVLDLIDPERHVRVVAHARDLRPSGSLSRSHHWAWPYSRIPS